MKAIKKFILELIEPPNATELAIADLKNAKRQLLLYQSTKEQSEAFVTFYQNKITRLENFIKNEG